MIMKRFVVLGFVAVLFASTASAQNSKKPPTPASLKAEEETRYLAFQIFTYGPDPKVASMGEGKNPIARFPDKATLRAYIEDIKRRIGTVGDRQDRLAVVLGHLSFDHVDPEITKFIELGFNLALETDVAVGFHIDDSMFWAKRKDLWSDPNNVEALDWDGTPCTGRRLDWQTGPGAQPDAAPPQMCFNSKAIQREVQKRAALVGKAIQAGVQQLERLNRPELFAGVIAGSETMIGEDFKTGKYLGYRALLNRGFSRERPPLDMDRERENLVQEFIELWTKGLADAGVSPRKIYSHTAFLPRRAFKIGGNHEHTYSQHNNFAPPSVAFGNHHRPGFSTYPAPGRFDDIYEELATHKQTAWASCEGTNLQLGSGPGQSGMTMETYLAKMFNHGATLVNIFSWGIGGEANKNMSFRVVTEGEEALRAYRKFLKGEPLIEAKTKALTLLERLPPKIHAIQKELPAWTRKTGNTNKATADKAAALMRKMQDQLKAKDFEEVERTADSILKLIGVSVQPAAPDIPEQPRTKAEGSALMERLPPKIQRIQKKLPVWVEKTGNMEKAASLMQELEGQLKAKNFEEAEKTADSILNMMGVSGGVKREIPK
jgi:hypothetical protein